MKDGFIDGELLGASIRRGHLDIEFIIIMEMYIVACGSASGSASLFFK